MKAKTIWIQLLPIGLVMATLYSGCIGHDETNPPDITGVYALTVKTRYGVTADTIEVRRRASTTTYAVTHKTEFQPNSHDLEHNRTFRLEEHLAIFVEHAGTLQDIDDGTVFLINYNGTEDRYRHGYKRIK